MSSIRLPIETSKQTFYPGNGRRKIQHTAKVGALSASADTEVEAKAELDRLVNKAVETENAITVIYSLFDRSEVWIATGDAHGWSYRIVRPLYEDSHYSRETMIGGDWTKDECLDHMKAHWYDHNARMIVEGICALAGWGRAECKKCHVATTLLHAPSLCVNPACGASL